jgi:RND family efflux transporter MFP subunit
MTNEQMVVDQKPVAEKPHRENRMERRSGGGKRGVWVLAIMVMAAVSAAGLFYATSGKEGFRKSPGEESASARRAESNVPRVQVEKPLRGGMERTTSQPGTIRAFQYAELYSKVPGFVKTLLVDRGSRVKKGDLLAEIYDPERNVAVLQATAELEHAKKAVKQAQAFVLAAQASVMAALANHNQAIATRDQMVADRDYRKKQFYRIKDLVERGSAEPRLQDEQQDAWHSAEAAVLSAEAGIKTAIAKVDEAKAKVEQAKADLEVAKAQVQVDDANLKMAKVWVQYTRIESPYDGFVIFRGESVHPGSFVRAATEGVEEPLLTVARSDLMRTIVPIPDNQVGYCQPGDPATVTVDAVPGRTFQARVSRVAESEDVNDRTMRVEIDIPNPDGVLRDGMFGRAFILLEKIIKKLTIPSSSLIERNGKGEGAVMVVRDGKVYRAKVLVGMDTGLRTEVIEGLGEDDQVIVMPDASMADGSPVKVESV